MRPTCYLTEDDGVDADSRNSEPGEESQYGEQNVGVCERAGEAKHDGHDVRDQESVFSPVPGK